MLGREVIEREQHVQVIGDFLDCLGKFGPSQRVEAFGGGVGVAAVLGVVDLGQGRLGARMRRSLHFLCISCAI